MRDNSIEKMAEPMIMKFNIMQKVGLGKRIKVWFECNSRCISLAYEKCRFQRYDCALAEAVR